jgi:hypothetical protein
MKINQVVSNQQGVVEMRNRRDSYQRDYDSSVAGMGKRDSYAYSQDGGGNDERHDLDPSEWYIVKDGKMFKVSVYPNQVQQAMEKGFSPSREEAKAKANNESVLESDPLKNREEYAKQNKQGQVYKKTYPGDKVGMSKSYAYDIKRTGPKGVLPENEQGLAEEETMGKVSQATAKDVTIDNPDGTKTIAPLARLTKDPQGNLSLGKPVAGMPGAPTQPGQEQQDKIQAGQQIRIATAEDLNHISRLAGLSK